MIDLEFCSHQMSDKNRCILCGLFDYQIKLIDDLSKRTRQFNSDPNVILLTNPTKTCGNLRQQFLRGKSRSMIAQKFDWSESEEPCQN